jgi:hypothetical protein
MTVEQSKEDPVKALTSVVQIQNVRLREVAASSKAPSRLKPMSFHLNISHAATVEDDVEDGFVIVATMDTKLFGPVEAGAQPPEDLSSLDVYASVKATFELAYKIPENFVVERKDLQSFANLNGVFNAWPYFREFIQSTFTRMNFPLVVLPLLRLGPPSAVPQQK